MNNRTTAICMFVLDFLRGGAARLDEMRDIGWRVHRYTRADMNEALSIGASGAGWWMASTTFLPHPTCKPSGGHGSHTRNDCGSQ